jgi:quercetin dioxygenase-like cupin family protein
MNLSKRFGIALLLCCVGAGSLPQTHQHLIVAPAEVTWGPASPKLPAGAQFARLLGDPSKPGELYVFRAKLPDGYSVPPHWHPADEHITVIAGTMTLGFGERRDDNTMVELPTGSYAMLPKEAPHYNRMKGETILQFHGVGPYDIVYVNPNDDPSRSSSRD